MLLQLKTLGIEEIRQTLDKLSPPIDTVSSSFGASDETQIVFEDEIQRVGEEIRRDNRDTNQAFCVSSTEDSEDKGFSKTTGHTANFASGHPADDGIGLDDLFFFLHDAMGDDGNAAERTSKDITDCDIGRGEEYVQTTTNSFASVFDDENLLD